MPRENGRNPYVKAVVGGLAAVIPLYLIELATEHFYFSHDAALFFFFSSMRLPFFITFIGITAFIFGRHSDGLFLTWSSYAISLAWLYSLLYVGCNPRVCYSTGIDGLEPLRSYSFFLAEGFALSAVGLSSKVKFTGFEKVLINSTAFYGTAYYPVIFTIAGAKLIAPLSPFPVLGFVALLSFITTTRVAGGVGDWRTGLAVPSAMFSALSLVSIGIATQYTPEAVYSMGVLFACVLGASLLGALGTLTARNAISRLTESKVMSAGLVVVVLFSIVLITPDAVTGTAPGPATNSYYFQSPVVMGGFDAGPSVVTTGVAAIFSFKGTNASRIQPDNFLAAGIGIHSPNCCVDGIDYGYRADVFLYHNASEVFAASAWEACDTIIACGGHPWRHQMFFSSTRVNSSLDSGFQLSMRWENSSVTWYYGTEALASFKAPVQENPDFNAGWLGPSATPSAGGWPFFQFGIMSAFPINRSGWSVTVSCPSILSNARWECIGSAELFQGDISFWKALWRWGENYPGSGASVNVAGQSITFQHSQTSVRDFQSAW